MNGIPGTPTGGAFSGTPYKPGTPPLAGPGGVPPSRGRPEFVGYSQLAQPINWPGVWAYPGGRTWNTGYGWQILPPTDSDRLVQRITVTSRVFTKSGFAETWDSMFFTFRFGLQESGGPQDWAHIADPEAVNRTVTVAYWRAFMECPYFSDVDAPIYPYLLPAGASLRFQPFAYWETMQPAEMSVDFYTLVEMTDA